MESQEEIKAQGQQNVEETKIEENARQVLTLDDFKVIKTIGAGTFGKVYLAMKDDEPVAIKKLKK